MLPRKRQEQQRSQIERQVLPRPYSSSLRQKQPLSWRKTYLYRTILLLFVGLFFCFYTVVFSRAKDSHFRYLNHLSEDGNMAAVVETTKREKHSLRERKRRQHDPLGNAHPDLQWAQDKQRERDRQKEWQIGRQREEVVAGDPKERLRDDGSDEGGDHGKGGVDSIKEGDDFEGGKGENPGSDENNVESVNYHTVFSTDCSPYQRWQSYLLFFHAHKVHQPGKITRIASGCDEKEAKEELEWHNKFITDQISSDYAIHLTPRFQGIKDENGKETNKDYKFFNKPFGMLHWMEHSANENFRFSASDLTSTTQQQSVRDDTIVILLDPDMVLTRPITRDFPLDPSLHRAKGNLTPPGGRPTRVAHGRPFAQLFGFGNQWKEKLDLAKATSDPATPAGDTNEWDASYHYPAGPPYLATARDFYRIAVKWAEFVPRVYAQYPELLAEMFAYSLAAAHLELPHQLMNTLMVSDIGVAVEGWALFEEDVEPENMCGFAQEVSKGEGGGLGKSGKRLTLPSTLHFCQRYMLGKEFFGKRRVPKDFFSCDRPLLLPPPANLSTLYDYWIPPPSPGFNEGGVKKEHRRKVNIQRTAFMLCYMIRSMNDAAKFYKERNCDEPEMEERMQLWHM